MEEVVALQRQGYQVDGYECHPNLVDSANRLLRRLDLEPSVRSSPRDAVPDDDHVRNHAYVGLIVGWGAYTLIKGRDHRIRLLKALRAAAAPGVPILVSFFVRKGTPTYLRVVARVANLVACVVRGERVEPGDDLAPNFVHYFAEDEIRDEFGAAGFELVFFSSEGYGHAVGRISAAAPSAAASQAAAPSVEAA